MPEFDPNKPVIVFPEVIKPEKTQDNEVEEDAAIRLCDVEKQIPDNTRHHSDGMALSERNVSGICPADDDTPETLLDKNNQLVKILRQVKNQYRLVETLPELIDAAKGKRSGKTLPYNIFYAVNRRNPQTGHLEKHRIRLIPPSPESAGLTAGQSQRIHKNLEKSLEKYRVDCPVEKIQEEMNRIQKQLAMIDELLQKIDIYQALLAKKQQGKTVEPEPVKILPAVKPVKNHEFQFEAHYKVPVFPSETAALEPEIKNAEPLATPEREKPELSHDVKEGMPETQLKPVSVSYDDAVLSEYSVPPGKTSEKSLSPARRGRREFDQVSPSVVSEENSFRDSPQKSADFSGYDDSVLSEYSAPPGKTSEQRLSPAGSERRGFDQVSPSVVSEESSFRESPQKAPDFSGFDEFAAVIKEITAANKQEAQKARWAEKERQILAQQSSGKGEKKTSLILRADLTAKDIAVIRSEAVQILQRIERFADSRPDDKAAGEWKSYVKNARSQMDHAQSKALSAGKQSHLEGGGELIQLKSEVQSYLSRIAGNRLAAGNADLTDLSDPLRPMRASEQFGNIYTGPWDDALEELQVSSGLSEQEAIHVLHDYVMQRYASWHALRTAVEQSDEFQSMETFVPEVGKLEKNNISVKDRLGRIFFEEIKGRKSLKTPFNGHAFQKDFKQKLQLTSGPFFDAYCQALEKPMAAMICQERPCLFVSPRPGDRIHPEQMTGRSQDIKKNITVALPVWPAVFLYEGGPLLSKGSVEPLRTVRTTAEEWQKSLQEKKEDNTDRDFKVTLLKKDTTVFGDTRSVNDDVTGKSLPIKQVKACMNDLYERLPDVALFQVRPFLKSYYELALFGEDYPERAVAGRFLFQLKEHFKATRQPDGFEHLKRLMVQERVQNFMGKHSKKECKVWLSDESVISRQDVLKIIRNDIQRKRLHSHTSIHGHPRDLMTEWELAFSRLDRSAGTVNKRVKEETRDFVEDSKLFQHLAESMTYADLSAIQNAVDNNTPLTEQQLSQVVWARKALLDIQLSRLGQRYELSALKDSALWDSVHDFDCFIKLQAITELRSPQIFSAQRKWLMSQHDRAVKHPKVVIEGGGPTGLLTALTQFEAGADVCLLEQRSTDYDRVQVVRLDPKWMHVLKFYLGERFYDLFRDGSTTGQQGRGMIREDGFGEITTRHLEDALHMELSEIISMRDAEGGIERFALHKVKDMKKPQDGGKYTVLVELQDGNKTRVVSKEVDVLVCAGGKNSRMVSKKLQPVTVTETKNYGVCTWESPKIKNPALHTFDDFRQLVVVDDKFEQALKRQWQAMLSVDKQKEWLEPSVMAGNAWVSPYLSEDDFQLEDFLKAIRGQVVQTRCFENKGLIYIGMEIPDAFAGLQKRIMEKMESRGATDPVERKQMLTFVRQAWFQAVANVYDLERIGATADCMDQKFLSTFPVFQHRLEKNVFHEQEREAEIVVVAAGDAAASPHFMRYSGLTGAREDVFHIKDYMHACTSGDPDVDFNYQRDLLESAAEETADFVISRGHVFLEPVSSAGGTNHH